MKAYYEVISDVVTPVEGRYGGGAAPPDGPGPCARAWSRTRCGRPRSTTPTCERFGLLDYLPVRVYSSRAGYIKPDERIFRQALDRFDVAPAEAVFVGDKLDVDVAGPQKIGMRADPARVSLPRRDQRRDHSRCPYREPGRAPGPPRRLGPYASRHRLR